ncbi:MAG TPA: PxKF domain-containing protein, partial [Thermomicrobiales bacterium]|nr:PxKF domain-containing protein [Thermomicrobiales bacterium]
ATNGNGWNNTDVTVTFTCADATSGVASCTAPQTVTTESADQPVTGTATDNAGNTATDPAKVSIDKTPPTIGGAATAPPNANGWYNGDVTVGFTCDDALSGVASCQAPVTVTTEGTNQSVTGTAKDAAGNSASTTYGGINVDKTPPTLNGTPSGPTNGSGWYTGDVTVTWACGDALSGIASCPSPSTVTGEGGNLSATGTATDKAGNATSTTVSGIKIDRTAPSTAASVAGTLFSGWYAGPVTVTLTANDNLSGVAQTYYSVDGGAPHPYKGSFAFDQGGTHTLTFWSVDTAGNTENQTAPGHSLTLQVDKTPPTITGAVSAQPNGNGWYNAPVMVSFTCADNETGIADCPAPVIVAGPGKNLAVTGTATDNAGNTNSATVGGINIDLAAPTLAGVATTQPNAAGWYTGNVTIHWAGTDELSGIDPATQPADSVITGEGSNLGAGPVTVSDLAGNVSAPASVSGIKIDRRPPQISGAATTQPNAAGWYNASVTVHFTCADPALADGSAGSGVAQCPSDQVLSANGADQGASGSATDVAGNTSAPFTVGGINIDALPPQTTAALSCTGSNGWCRGQTATVVLTATDQTGLSGVKEIHYTVNGGQEKVASGASVSVTVPLAAQSGAATVKYYAVDNAGNLEAQSGVSLLYDNLAPTITHAQSPAANGAGWTNADTTVQFIAVDDPGGSGVDVSTVACGSGGTVGPVAADGSVTCSATVSAETPAGGLTVNAQAADKAGNVGSDAAVVKLDKTPPTIGGAPTTKPNGNGWYNGPVTVAFACSDALSGVASCQAPITVTTDGANQTVTGVATDIAGNRATAPVGGINIDTAPPTISGKATTAPNGNGWYNGPVAIHFTCSDALSGIQQCPADVVLNKAGANQAVSGTAVDNAGNAATYTVSGINIDLTSPTLTGAAATPANAAGWYNTDVTINWTGTDDLAGIDPATQPAASVITGEGSNLGASAKIADKAGNVGTGTVGGIKIDRTPPTISGAPTTQPNAAGWYKGAVTVHFTCADPALADGTPGSGVAQCPSDQVLSADGADQGVASGPAADVAGNSSTGITVKGINIDTQAPQTTAALSCTGSNGWCRGSSATVVLTAADQPGLSGVKEIHYSVNGGQEQVADGASVTVTVPLDATSGQATITYHAVDKAGNTEAPAGASINYDNIAPTVTPTLSPAANAAGWSNATTTVHFTAVDNPGGSGVDPTSVTPDVTVSAETAGQVVTGQAQDYAGNVGTTSVTVELDMTAPTITGAATTSANKAGWYNGPVTVHFTCSDALSGIATCPADVILTANGANQAVTGTAQDVAGNTATYTVSGINIDTAVPTITVSGVANGATYTLGAVPTPACSATDSGGSGLTGPCTGTLSGGTPNGVGSYTYTATASDAAGNTATVTVKYRVIYRFDGFLQPINDTAHQTGLQTSVFKGGSTVPAKFQLKDAAGNIVQANSLPIWLAPAQGSSTAAPVDETVYSDPVDTASTYRWDSTGQQYIFNWGTKGFAAGNYWRIGVQLDDGQIYYVNLGLR